MHLVFIPSFLWESVLRCLVILSHLVLWGTGNKMLINSCEYTGGACWLQSFTTWCERFALFGWKTPISVPLGLSLLRWSGFPESYFYILLLEGIGLAAIIRGEREPRHPVYIHSINPPICVQSAILDWAGSLQRIRLQHSPEVPSSSLWRKGEHLES